MMMVQTVGTVSHRKTVFHTKSSYITCEKECANHSELWQQRLKMEKGLLQEILLCRAPETYKWCKRICRLRYKQNSWVVQSIATAALSPSLPSDKTRQYRKPWLKHFLSDWPEGSRSSVVAPRLFYPPPPWVEVASSTASGDYCWNRKSGCYRAQLIKDHSESVQCVLYSVCGGSR